MPPVLDRRRSGAGASSADGSRSLAPAPYTGYVSTNRLDQSNDQADDLECLVDIQPAVDRHLRAELHVPRRARAAEAFLTGCAIIGWTLWFGFAALWLWHHLRSGL